MTGTKNHRETDVLIIGAGATGTGVARDLALRGVNCLVAEMGNINAGASGRNHGLLHSGARYVASDPVSAAECRDEARILKKIAPQCIDDCGGLFVAVKGDDESFIRDFPDLCRKAGISCHPVSPKDARQMEPELSDEIITAFQVEDAAVDPFHLSLENINQAIEKGAAYLPHHQLISMKKSGRKIEFCVLENQLTGQSVRVNARVIINATGAWAGMVCNLVGIPLDMIYSKGTLLITHSRMAGRVINRLRPAADGDILVPGGTVSVFGTTSVRLDDLDDIRPTVKEADELVRQGRQMVPRLGTTRYIRAYAGVRPLIQATEKAAPASGKAKKDDRSVSRGFVLMDHEDQGVDNFITITGGKLTTFRLMAQKTSDLAAQKLHIQAPCITAVTQLHARGPSQLTEPGLSVHAWVNKHSGKEPIMCECEMIPQSHFAHLISWLKENRDRADLNALRIHSRLGKGACQGTFCALRVTGYMYDKQYLTSDEGVHHIKDMLRERFKGQRPVLWGTQLAQSELCEAIYCSFAGFDMNGGSYANS